MVEDSAVHRRLLEEAFKAAGQPIKLEPHPDADSAWAAIDRLRFEAFTEWPDFAIVDIGLPGMSGIELVDRIRHLRHFDDWPIVILTSSQDPEDELESLLAKATGYFVKPTASAGYTALARDILRFLGYVSEHAPAGKPPARKTARKPQPH
jgi:DNA-binding response OmpR family regulator